MWDLTRTHPQGRSRLWRFIMTFTALILAVFAWIVLMSPVANAAQGTWQDDGSISYEGKTYRGPQIASSGDGRDLPDGARMYSNADQPGQMAVIYFEPGTDPSTSPRGQYVTYSLTGTGSMGNKSSPVEVTFQVTTQSEENANSTTSEEATSCKIDGVGWLVCPVTNFLATGMDWVFNVLSQFVEVRPLEITSESPMMRMWSIMRNIANAAFVIAFLVIIYSQLTSMGIGNYGIKKLFPRLIIAAILVNLSFIICALAIDLSNVLGHAFQSMFISLRTEVLGIESNGWQLLTWESVAGFVLAGGAVGGAALAGVGIAFSNLGAFTAGGVMLLLLPILAGALLTIIVVLLILAARQAIITLLVIIAPLAFVAYLLPNTEKWFEKWRNLFMTMMIFFPAFSLVFGGAQLAGLMIIQNAPDSANGINMIILGMAVQIAPLAITPLLLRLSGSLLSRIAGIVNNPGKGLVDRTKNWSNDHLAARRAMEMARTRQMVKDGTLKRRHVVRRTAVGLDNQKRLRETMKKVGDQDADSLYAVSDAGLTAHEATHRSDRLHELTETEVKIHTQKVINTVGTTLHDENLKLEATKAELADKVAVTGAIIAEYKTNEYLNKRLDPNQSIEARRSLGQLAYYADKLPSEDQRKKSAENVLNREIMQSLEGSVARRQYAAGFDNLNGQGETRIMATVKSQIESEKDKLVENIKVASDIKPGDVKGLSLQFEAAVRQGNAEGMRAYADLLTAAANPGVSELRKVLSRTEHIMPIDARGELKAHINSSSAMNAAAEDIATWSRDEMARQLTDITNDQNTWKALTASAFAGMKKSSQEAALRIGAISNDTAAAILKGPVFQNLKPDMQLRIEKLAARDPSYKANIEDPFKP